MKQEPSTFNQDYKKAILVELEKSVHDMKEFNSNKENLYWACRIGNVEIVKAFHQSGFNILADNYNAFKLSAKHEHFELIQYFVENTSYLPYINDVFLDACLEGHTDIVKYLIRKGADIHCEDDAAFIKVVGKNHTELIRYFIFDLNIIYTEHLQIIHNTLYHPTVKEHILQLFKERDTRDYYEKLKNILPDNQAKDLKRVKI